jgi:hypothetical protein
LSSAVIRVPGIEVAERPRFSDDFLFWQYPAHTEKQAYQNHLVLRQPSTHPSTVDLYLGLPWATIIDRKVIDGTVFDAVRAQIALYRKEAASRSSRVRVHTVCQHIHWVRLLPLWRSLGITDIHLSHYTASAGVTLRENGFTGGSWVLYAPSIDLADRTEGELPNIPVQQRRYLASFIGAHMPHYINDLRRRLQEHFRTQNHSRILIELQDKWHFNDIVYSSQVKGVTPSSREEDLIRMKTERYNAVLSNSVFSLCPSGAGVNTLRLWESLAFGSIPVIFDKLWIPPERLENMFNNCSLYYSGDVNHLYDFLAGLEDSRTIARMSDLGRKVFSLSQNLTCF